MKELAPGAQLGKYTLERLLGSGGMGAVWLAHDADLDRKVALKVLKPALVGDDTAQARLLREARAMARLRHPNVITAYDASSAGGHDFVAMELIDGEHMATWLANGDHSPDTIVRALLAAGRGLAAAHAAGMVHRDFKPHNVLIERGSGRVLVTDFGLARGLEAIAPIDGAAPTRSAEPTPPTVRVGNPKTSSRDGAPTPPTVADGDATAADGPGGRRKLASSPVADAAKNAEAAAPAADPTTNAEAAAPAADPTKNVDAAASPAKPSANPDVTASAAKPEPAGDAFADTVRDDKAPTPSERGALHSPLTLTGVVLGTPAYMAPEQMVGDRADARADQFAFCITAWEALAGKRPFPGKTMVDIQLAIEGQAPVAADRIPPKLRPILMGGMAIDPRDRWPSMDVVLDKILRVTAPRYRARVVIGAAIALGGLGGGAFAINARGSEPPAPAPASTCPSGRASLAATWSPVIRGQWSARLPESTRDAVLGDIDRWAAAWEKQVDANCARPNDGEFGARKLCLESQRDEVSWVLGSSSPQLLKLMTTVELERVFPDSTSCQHAPRAIAPQPPADPDTRRRVTEIRQALGEHRVQANTGSIDMPRITQLVADARAIDYPPVQAEALHAMAVLMLIASLDDGPRGNHGRMKAFTVFGEAVDLAEGAGYDRVRVDGLLGQLEIALSTPGRHADRNSLITKTDVVIKRLGDPGRRHVFDGLRAQLAYHRGEWSQAIELSERARDGWRALGADASAAQMAGLAAYVRELRHHGDDVERASIDLNLMLEHARPRSRADYLYQAARLAWRRGKLNEARVAFEQSGTPEPILSVGGGDSSGGSISGVVRGIDAVANDMPNSTRLELAGRRGLPVIEIRRAQNDSSWIIPTDRAGAFQLNALTAGTYSVMAISESAAGDYQAVRATSTVTAGAAAKIELVFPVPIDAPYLSGTNVQIAMPVAGSTPTTLAGLRAQLAKAPWFTIANWTGYRSIVLGVLTRPYLSCSVTEAEVSDFGKLEPSDASQISCAIVK